MSSRRKFITDLGKTSALAFMPVQFYDNLFSNDTLIEDIDFIRVSAPYERIRSHNRQHQTKANDIYDELRQSVYAEVEDGETYTSTLAHYYIRVKTKGGIIGIYGELERSIIPIVLNQLKPFLIGKDALAVETIWDQMYRSNRHARAGHFMMAISAVDNALWDIRGRYFEAPVYELLGGPTRKEVTVYGSCLGFSIEKGRVGPKAQELYSKGFEHQKWFTAYGPGDGNKGLIRNVELVEELRTSLGEEAQIMIDSYMGLDLPFAQRWCKEVEQYNPFWLEEAFPTDRLESFIRLSQSTTVPIATGEHFYSRWEVQNFLKADAIQVVQADPEWCGGVSELVKICSLSSVYGAKVVPHGHGIHAALHVVAAQSPEVCPLVEYLINHMTYKMHFQKDKMLPVNGKIALPTKPGFGIEIDDNITEKLEVIAKA